MSKDRIKIFFQKFEGLTRIILFLKEKKQLSKFKE